MLRLRPLVRCFSKLPRSAAAVSKSILNTIPQALNIESAWPQLREAVKIDPRTLIVIDDDPTGCQTVYDINVLLDYSVESIRKQMEKNDRMFYVLTNTRGLPESEAVSITSKVIDNIYKAQFDINTNLGRLLPIQILSRSDSTLRGHYPAEIDAIMTSSPEVYDATIIVPAFFEGGRITFNDVHYLTEDEFFIPVGETPFAKDPHFSYSSSNLVDWIVEKSKGEITRDKVVSISLQDIRQGGPHEIADKLESLQHGAVVVVNAVHQHDLNTFVLGLLHAEGNGFNFLYRTAASFVSSRAALEPRALLGSYSVTAGGAHLSRSAGGLTVVGSYVPKSTAQLNKIIASNLSIEKIEIDVNEFLVSAASSTRDELMDKARGLSMTVSAHLASGKDVVLFTSRAFVKGAGLEQTALVSRLLTDIVSSLTVAPSFLIAKGGVTSHDVAAQGLAAKVCEVVGQIEPGVPLWRLGPEAKFPNMPYVVFPGNVGDDEALLRVLRRLGVKDAVPAAEQVPGATAAQQTEGGNQFTLRAESSRLLDALETARSSSRAIAAFNVYNLEGAKAVVQAAELMNAPVMLQVHPASLDFGGVPLLHMLYSIKIRAKVPVFVHLDHATKDDDVLLSLSNGVDSVMVDGSALPLEENIKWTSRMTSIAHAHGCIVEAELGRLVGEEDGLSVAEKEGKMTDPAVVARFLRETKVDMLAVTIGNVHGKYIQPPQLDFARLAAISEAVRSVKDEDRLPDSVVSGPVKLVLHGASGLSQALINNAMAHGVCKFNVNTDLREAVLDVFTSTFGGSSATSGKKKPDVLPLMQLTTAAMQDVALKKLELFGWKK